MRRTLRVASLVMIALSPAVFAKSPDRYFYIAGKAGIFSGAFNHTYYDQTDLIAQTITANPTQHGYTAGVAAGYRRFYKRRFFYGAELAAQVENHQASFQSGASTSAFSDNVQIQYHSDLTFVPGIQLTKDIASYLKVGVSFASLQDSLSSPTGYTPAISTYNTHQNTFGFTAGLGFSKELTRKTKIFIESNYHDYGSVHFQNFQNFTASYSHSTHVYSCDVLVGLAYRI